MRLVGYRSIARSTNPDRSEGLGRITERKVLQTILWHRWLCSRGKVTLLAGAAATNSGHMEASIAGALLMPRYSRLTVRISASSG